MDIYDHCNDQGVVTVQQRFVIVTYNSCRDWTPYGLSLNPSRTQVGYCAPQVGLTETTSEEDDCCYPPGFALWVNRSNRTCFGS